MIKLDASIGLKQATQDVAKQAAPAPAKKKKGATTYDANNGTAGRVQGELQDPNEIIRNNKVAHQRHADSIPKEELQQMEDEVDVEELNLEAMKIELEHRIRENVQESHGTLQNMLNQPFVGNILTYENKQIQAKETAYVQKASAYSKGKPFSNHAVETITKKALQVQNERFDLQMSGKDQMIQRQQKVMIR